MDKKVKLNDLKAASVKRELKARGLEIKATIKENKETLRNHLIGQGLNADTLLFDENVEEVAGKSKDLSKEQQSKNGDRQLLLEITKIMKQQTTELSKILKDEISKQDVIKKIEDLERRVSKIELKDKL